MQTHRRDILLGVVLLAVAGSYFHHSYAIRVFSGMASFSVNSRTVPQCYAILLGMLSLFLIVKGVVSLARHRQTAPTVGTAGIENMTAPVKANPVRYLPVLYTFILMVLYAVGMGYIGFTMSSALYIFLQILVLAPRNLIQRRLVLRAVVVAVGSSMIVHYVFVNHLNLILPKCAIL